MPLRALVAACIAVTLAAGGGQDASARTASCRPGRPVTPDGPSANAVSLGPVNGHQVDAVVYPRPDQRGDPWSQWGQGLVLDDGRFLSAAGDHLGADGNSYLFMYDPGRRRIVRFTDVLSHVHHRKGEWGYGKIHAQMVRESCRTALIATYWGTDKDLRYGGSYRGDHLFRLDTTTLKLENVDVPVPKHGIPTLAGDLRRGLLYGEAVVPTPADATGSEQGAFFAYDIAAHRIAFRADDERLTGLRNVMVDKDGAAYLAAAGGRLLVYEPGSEALRVVRERLPGGGTLRASTKPGPDGSVYGVTARPQRLFALRPDGRIDDLGPAGRYTTSMALAPDGSRFFYVPGAFGDSSKEGTPLVAVDTKSGKATTVAKLNDVVERKLGLTLGGSYSVAIDRSGARLYIGINAGRDREDAWGEVVLLVVHLS